MRRRRASARLCSSRANVKFQSRPRYLFAFIIITIIIINIIMIISFFFFFFFFFFLFFFIIVIFWSIVIVSSCYYTRAITCVLFQRKCKRIQGRHIYQNVFYHPSDKGISINNFGSVLVYKYSYEQIPAKSRPLFRMSNVQDRE